MPQPAAEERLSVEEYLRREDGAPHRSEYVDGHLFAVGGASDVHNRLARNIGGLLWSATRRSTCEAYISNMKVRVQERIFYYPDVMVVCETVADEKHFKRSPCLIVEVLSPSTAAVDRGEKLRHYLKLPSLEAYAHVSQDAVRLEVYRRQDGVWTYSVVEQGGALPLSCPPVTLALADVYENVPLGGSDELPVPPRLERL